MKNLMVKAPAEPDLANRRATEMMQRMKTVETLGADKEALYKEGWVTETVKVPAIRSRLYSQYQLFYLVKTYNIAL